MLDFAHYFRTVPQVLGVRRASHRQRSPGLAHHTGLFDDSCGGARCTGVESGRIFFFTSGFFFPSQRLSFRLHDSLGQCTRKCMEGNWADVRPASERRISSVDDLCARDAVCEPANGHDAIAMSWRHQFGGVYRGGCGCWAAPRLRACLLVAPRAGGRLTVDLLRARHAGGRQSCYFNAEHYTTVHFCMRFFVAKAEGLPNMPPSLGCSVRWLEHEHIPVCPLH